ncbi:MAG TPA: NlpC/P60 family protein [Solirubrobacteraceae bacterium]|nr:NlpC/P60 family protein [Solirubrobacteraceae bacterium]
MLEPGSHARPLCSRRFALQLACTLALVGAAMPGAGAGASAAAATTKKLTAANWDSAQQQQVLNAGVMGEVPGFGFAGSTPLSAQAESAALAAIAAREELAPIVFQTDVPITLVRFDALLVDQLGLGDVAEHVQQVAVAAGLAPPSYFGSEVLARYLGLRYNHPAGEDALELYPWNAITRAEAAHSFAVALGLESWALTGAREALSGFSLPQYTPAQREVLHIAVAKIGMPYVWGGTTDNTADGLEHGGYDCSGFAWRVYKVSGLPWGKRILGRTAAQQAGEIPKSSRIHLEDVQPGDLLFFGSASFDATATESNVIHEGIALSAQWAIHSSDQGVYVLPLTSGWLAEDFTWARRVL